MATLKKAAGRLIPYPLIATMRRVVHFGLDRCEVCQSWISRRLDSGYGYPVLERLQVVGGMRRKADLCPVCHAGARERLIWLYLSRALGIGDDMKRSMTIAHFAPEKGLSARLRAMHPSGYQAYDFSPERYRHRPDTKFQDLQQLSIPDGSVDLLICNHVMEHVFDLETSLREVRRVLSDAGVAIMQVPISLKLNEMRDGGRDLSESQRIERFGQDDHVRLFTEEGYRQSLAAASLAVDVFDAFDADAETATVWDLDPLERLLLIRR